MSQLKDGYLGLLGMRVRDAVSGFEGVVESIAYDLYGCIQAVVRPPVSKEKPNDIPDGRWLDCKRLVVLDRKAIMDVPNFFTAPRGAEIGPADKPQQ